MHHPSTTPPLYRYDHVHLLPEEQIDLHQQASWELSYIITGSGRRLIGDTSEAFQSGEVVLIPPGIPHCWYFDCKETDSRGKIANITLVFESRLLLGIGDLFPEMAPAIDGILRRTEAVRFERQRAMEIARRLEAMDGLDGEHCAAHIMGLLPLLAPHGVEAVAGRYRKPDKDRDRMEMVRLYVTCNYNRDITLDDIARHVGMNRSSFCVWHKRMTGATFIDQLNRHRVDNAVQLLQQSSASISSIAYQTGFSNAAYFNRVFKKLMGAPPSAFIGKKSP